MQIEFTSYTTSHEGSVFVMIGNEQVDVHEAREIERVAEQAGLSMQKVREVRLLFGTINSQSVINDNSDVIITKEDRCKDLRNKCNKKVKNLAIINGKEYWEIHRQFSPKPQKEMSECELQDKLEWVCKQISNHERN
jgi:hypothetical protein